LSAFDLRYIELPLIAIGLFWPIPLLAIGYFLHVTDHAWRDEEARKLQAAVQKELKSRKRRKAEQG
jgi:hypothetical protein